MTPKPGIYYDVPYETYASWRAFNSGVVSYMNMSPKHGDAFIRGLIRKPDTPSMRFGRQIHTAILEPDRKGDILVSTGCSAILKSGKRKDQPCGVGTKALFQGQWFCEKHAPIQADYPSDYLTAQQFEDVGEIVLAAHNGPAADMFSRPAKSEVSLLFEYRGLLMKGRVDRLNDDLDMLLDLKKSQVGEAGLDSCQNKIMNYGYHRQMALYRLGVELLTGKRPKRAAWVFLEDGPPYDVNVIYALEQDLEIGLEEVDSALLRYKACLDRGEFSGYLEGGAWLGALPDWYKKRHVAMKEHDDGRNHSEPDAPAREDYYGAGYDPERGTWT